MQFTPSTDHHKLPSLNLSYNTFHIQVFLVTNLSRDVFFEQRSLQTFFCFFFSLHCIYYKNIDFFILPKRKYILVFRPNSLNLQQINRKRRPFGIWIEQTSTSLSYKNNRSFRICEKCKDFFSRGRSITNIPPLSPFHLISAYNNDLNEQSSFGPVALCLVIRKRAVTGLTNRFRILN